jgi:hypothetical protein
VQRRQTSAVIRDARCLWLAETSRADQHDGVWVCEPTFTCVLGRALRQGLISTAVQRTQQSGRADKMTRLYNYLCSVEFRLHIEGVVEVARAGTANHQGHSAHRRPLRQHSVIADDHTDHYVVAVQADSGP